MLPVQTEHGRAAGGGEDSPDGEGGGAVPAAARGADGRLSRGRGGQEHCSVFLSLRNYIVLQVDRIEKNLKEIHPEVRHVDLEVL